MTDKEIVAIAKAVEETEEEIEKAKDIADAKEAVVQLGLKKAKKLLEGIDFTDVDVYDDARKEDTKRRKIDNLAQKASESLTCKETLAISLSAMRFAIGQWPDTMDKHNMASAATEFAAQMVETAAELKKDMDVDCFALAQEMDDEPINMD